MRSPQTGFSLIEMIVVTALTSLIGIWAASAWVQQSEDAASASMGAWLLMVKNAVDQMLVSQSEMLINGSLPAASQKDYTDVWRPSLSELVGAGHLPKGFAQRAPLPYTIRIKVLEPSGLCLTVGCKIEALTFVVPKFDQLNSADNILRLGKILESLDGRAASVTHLSPLRIRGGTLDLPNPPTTDMTALPPGSVVLHSFYDATADARFLRQGDRRDVRLKGNLQVEGAIASGGAIAATGRISTAAHLKIGAQATQGAVCDESGLIAQSDTVGLLVCQGGQWRSGQKQDGGSYVMKVGVSCEARDHWKVVRRNPQTGDCSCPSGFKSQIIALWRYPYHYSEEEFHTIGCMPE